MTTGSASPRPIDAMIVGAQKAGTSSLAYYLGQHPQICTHQRLELSYFVDELDFALGYAENFRRYFGHCPPHKRLLGKSVTAMTEARLVDRLHDHNAGMRIVVILRDPVARAYSAYWWARRKGYENLPTFEQALDADPARHGGRPVRVRSTSYISFGHYGPQVDRLFERFGRYQVQVHLFDDLQTDAPAVCRRAFEFIGVDSDFRPDVSSRRNTSSTPRSARIARLLSSQHPLKRATRRLLPLGMAEGWKRTLERANRVQFVQPPISEATRTRLAAHFAPYNAELGHLIGRDLSHWGRLEVPQAGNDD